MSLQYPPHIVFSFKYSSYHSDLFPFEEGLFGTRVSVVYHENQRILGNISKKNVIRVFETWSQNLLSHVK